MMLTFGAFYFIQNRESPFINFKKKGFLKCFELAYLY